MSGVKVEVKAIDWCYENAAVIYIDIDGERFEGYIKSLDAGEEVRIIDMRGRIEPQYKILDSSGAYWYLPVTKIKILEQEIN